MNVAIAIDAPDLGPKIARLVEERGWNQEETDELLSLQGTGGPLTGFGVEHFVSIIERRRKIIEQIHAIAGTEQLDLLEKFVNVLYEKICPFEMYERAHQSPTAPSA